MGVQSDLAERVVERRAPALSTDGAGILAGLIGAAALALWFLILDTLAGHPLYTPTVLGTALFRGGVGLETPASLPVSMELVVFFTFVHVLVFFLIGWIASHLLALAAANPNAGFGVVLLFVVFEFGFIAVCMLFAQPVLQALAWPAVLVGNLLAAGAVAVTLWRLHPRLTILP
jgi:hypothetical protein